MEETFSREEEQREEKDFPLNLMLRREVLRKKSDFDSLYNKGKSVGERYIVVFYRNNGLSYNRKAFLASKKVGKSVQRNRARRLMKESFRQLSGDCNKGFDIIFIARNTIDGKKEQEVRYSMKNALKKAGIL